MPSDGSLLHFVLVDPERIGLKSPLRSISSNSDETSIPRLKKFLIQCTSQAPSLFSTYFRPALVDWCDITAIWNKHALPNSNRPDEWDQIDFPGNLIVHSNTADVYIVLTAVV